jgi:hypothetical protein
MAYNISKFVSNKSTKRKEVYSLIKRFYNMRSRISHGGIYNNDDICQLVKEVFVLTSRIIRKILIREDLHLAFVSANNRRCFLEQLLFSNKVLGGVGDFEDM